MPRAESRPVPDDDRRGVSAAAHRAREVRIALAVTEELSRSDACRLAADPLDCCARSRRRSAGDVGLAAETFALARRVAAGAAAVARAEERGAEAIGARIVTRGEPDYPEELEALSHPPPALYLRGELPRAPAIAIVGPRNADPWALDAARTFAQELARLGLVVVSGFARGVDAAAHRGALLAPEGRTVAVLGCGLDVRYPRQHYRLAGEIARRGTVVTEFPLGRGPAPWHFPVRNRLIAALADATLVVQASSRSGALITARFALDLGREVLALPGRTSDARSAGSNALLRDGAHVVLEPEDVLLALPLACRPVAAAHREIQSSGDPLLALLERSPLPVDELAARSGLPVDRLLARLSDLELQGRAERLPGATWARCAGRPAR
jgi:DNA processing protein